MIPTVYPGAAKMQAGRLVDHIDRNQFGKRYMEYILDRSLFNLA